ncbi:MAG: HIT family protein [Candidatus Woesearchaeota archaeon]
MADCIFCRIVNGDVPCHKVWESDSHLAFLNITPSMRGFTVVVSKDHLPSKVESLPDDEYVSLWRAAREAAKKLTAALGVERTAMVAEGTGVDHAHVKLIPLIGTSLEKPWSGGEAKSPVTFDRYEGFVSTREGPRADDEDLAALAERIREMEVDSDG